MQVRSEERLGEEQRRNRELLARIEREKQLELENYAIRNNALEQVTRDKDFSVRTAVYRIRIRGIRTVAYEQQFIGSGSAV